MPRYRSNAGFMLLRFVLGHSSACILRLEYHSTWVLDSLGHVCLRVSPAFTCFQLTELVRRVPKTLERFSTDVLIVTALPDLYFDEDVRDREARASFEHALEGLCNVAPASAKHASMLARRRKIN